VTVGGDGTRFAPGDYRTIFDTLSEGIFLHPPDSDEILEANARRAEMLGYTRAELLELTVSDVTDDDRIATLADGVRAASTRIDDIVERIREFDHLRQ